MGRTMHVVWDYGLIRRGPRWQTDPCEPAATTPLMHEAPKKFGKILNSAPLSGMFLCGHSIEKFETSALRTMLTLHLHGWAPEPGPR